jgi:eukaryotic translation initiation factor 2C
MVIERLKAYWSFSIKPTFGTNPKERAKLPKKIIYYRDGVSEGQYGKVVRDEVSAIRQAFEQVKKEKKWRHDVRVTAIVVTKRHHTRLYPISEADMEGEGNHCKPGTVVDTTITTPYFKEFFLQSHSGLKGTTKPAHYFVVADDVNWDIADLASFVSQLEHKSAFMARNIY